jgi:acylphosphatase
MADDGPSAGRGLARLEATVRGRVQGVGFRYFVLREADRLGLDGWVANRFDGAVELVAEGESGDLGLLVDGLRAGPPGAVVARVDVRWSTATGRFDGFEVRPSGHTGD